ncbi:MAG: fimbrillin family protein [Muribaculaceae bacterium]|nr:fimbrillin family protein [Muribaculaceae bacterium]
MNKIYLSVAIALIVCGCSNNELPQAGDANQVNFEASMPAQSRATASAFENGDQMGVFMTQYDGTVATPLQVSGNYATNIKSTLTAGKWINTPAIYWETGMFDVYAYYPYGKVTSVDNLAFNVQLDQSVPEADGNLSGYEASDFMWARNQGVERSESPVSLSFRHILSRVVVNLVKSDDYTGDLPATAEVYIHNTVPAALIDLSSGSVERNGREATATIKAVKSGDFSYSAVIVPQRLENRRPLVEVVADGVSFLVESTFVFKSGMSHTINVILANNPNQVKIEVGGEIIDWNK